MVLSVKAATSLVPIPRPADARSDVDEKASASASTAAGRRETAGSAAATAPRSPIHSWANATARRESGSPDGRRDKPVPRTGLSQCWSGKHAEREHDPADRVARLSAASTYPRTANGITRTGGLPVFEAFAKGTLAANMSSVTMPTTRAVRGVAHRKRPSAPPAATSGRAGAERAPRPVHDDMAMTLGTKRSEIATAERPRDGLRQPEWTLSRCARLPKVR